MYGETELMRRRAAELREQGLEIRALADRLVARTEAVGWTGRAADGLAARIRERSTDLREVAARHDAAADALTAHVAEVERLQEAIAVAERRADRTGDAPSSGSPPAGHKDWLTVEIPGS